MSNELKILKSRFDEFAEAELFYLEVARTWSCPESLKKSLKDKFESTRTDLLITLKNYFTKVEA
jgi:hypothetical protein